jgi:glutathione S-transferase
MGDQDKPEYRALQPFGQVPIMEEDGFTLFESGAIVLHIGERSETLLPKDPGARSGSKPCSRTWPCGAHWSG